MAKRLFLYLLLLVCGVANAQEKTFEGLYDSLKAAAAPYKTYRFEWVRGERFYDYPIGPDYPNKIKKVFNFLRAKREVVEAPDFIFRVVVHAHTFSPTTTLFAGMDRHIDYYKVSATYQLDVYIEVIPKTGKAFRPALVENYLMKLDYKMGVEDYSRRLLFEQYPTEDNYGRFSLEQHLYHSQIGIRERSPFFKQVEELLERFQKKGKL